MILIETDAKPFHAGQISRLLRADHAALFAQAGLPTHRELRETLDASIIRRAWFIDGELAAIAGLVSTLGESEGTIWAAISEKTMRHPFTVARVGMRFLDLATRTRDRLLTNILTEDQPSQNLAYFLGFRVEERGVVRGVKTALMSYSKRKAA